MQAEIGRDAPLARLFLRMRAGRERQARDQRNDGPSYATSVLAFLRLMSAAEIVQQGKHDQRHGTAQHHVGDDEVTQLDVRRKAAGEKNSIAKLALTMTALKTMVLPILRMVARVVDTGCRCCVPIHNDAGR